MAQEGRLRSLVFGHHLDRRSRLVGQVVLAAGLQVGAGAGIAYVAGFSAVRNALAHFRLPWLLVTAGGLIVSFIGYHYAYRQIYSMKGGPRLSRRQMRAVVIAGFGGFLAHGGTSLDKYALESGGADEGEASVRVASLGGMEHGILSLGGCAAAIVLLARGYRVPPMDFTLPWATLPVPGFLIGFWAAEHYKDRLDGVGWRRKLAVFLRSIHLVRAAFVEPRRHAGALLGMGLFWAGDLFAAWAGLAAFGFHMNGAQFIVGAGTGMVFTRRTGPFGGAGVLELVLPVTLWASGAPFGAAVVGVFAYRVLCVWLPMPFALSRLQLLRELGGRDEPAVIGPGAAGHRADTSSGTRPSCPRPRGADVN